MSAHYSGRDPETGAFLLVAGALVVALIFAAAAVWLVVS